MRNPSVVKLRSPSMTFSHSTRTTSSTGFGLITFIEGRFIFGIYRAREYWGGVSLPSISPRSLPVSLVSASIPCLAVPRSKARRLASASSAFSFQQLANRGDLRIRFLFVQFRFSTSENAVGYLPSPVSSSALT